MDTAGVSEIVPPREHGGNVSFHIAADRSQVYFSGEGRDLADPTAMKAGWRWASAAVRAQRWTAYDKSTVLGRPIVHEVEPVGKVRVDPNFKGDRDDASLTADRLRVTATHWNPEPAKGEYVQGTLPNVNWNQFASDGRQHNFIRGTVPAPGDNERIPTTGDEERARVKAQRAPTDPRQGTLL